jgi:hypothetical protein
MNILKIGFCNRRKSSQIYYNNIYFNVLLLAFKFRTGTLLVHATAMTALGSVFTLTSTSSTQHRSAQFSTVIFTIHSKKEGEKAKKASVFQVRVRDFLGLPGSVTLLFVWNRIWILQSDSYLDPAIRNQKRKKKKFDFDRIVVSKEFDIF